MVFRFAVVLFLVFCIAGCDNSDDGSDTPIELAPNGSPETDLIVEGNTYVRREGMLESAGYVREVILVKFSDNNVNQVTEFLVTYGLEITVVSYSFMKVSVPRYYEEQWVEALIDNGILAYLDRILGSDG